MSHADRSMCEVAITPSGPVQRTLPTALLDARCRFRCVEKGGESGKQVSGFDSCSDSGPGSGSGSLPGSDSGSALLPSLDRAESVDLP